LSKKKKTVIISLLIIVSVAIAMVAITSFAFTSYFQPRSDQPPTPDVAERTDPTANDNISSQTESLSSSSSSIIPTTIDIVSTTSAFPFVQRWAAEYENQQPASSGNVDVEYLTDIEIKEAKAEESDLAIVGITNENGAMYIPLSPQAVSIVYNIPSFPDIPSGLRLNSTTLFLMLNGSITQWNDAAIKDLNPNLNLPNEKIIVVHNSDDNNNNNSSSNNSSSSMLLLNRYLGFQDIINWPSDSIAASGPAELAETVRKTPYSVGYVDFSYAVQTRMTYAAIGNADGDYIVPSTQSIGQAVNLALQFHNSSTNGSPSSQQQPPTLNASRLVNGSYPIVGLYYGSLLANYDEEERKASILDFVEWLISDSGGQQTLLEVQYPPIYSSNNNQLATYAKTTMDTIIPN
jgi:ABC-type phosphate transport system substrate-binding protein